MGVGSVGGSTSVDSSHLPGSNPLSGKQSPSVSSTKTGSMGSKLDGLSNMGAKPSPVSTALVLRKTATLPPRTGSANASAKTEGAGTPPKTESAGTPPKTENAHTPQAESTHTPPPHGYDHVAPQPQQQHSFGRLKMGGMLAGALGGALGFGALGMLMNTRMFHPFGGVVGMSPMGMLGMGGMGMGMGGMGMLGGLGRLGLMAGAGYMLYKMFNNKASGQQQYPTQNWHAGGGEGAEGGAQWQHPYGAPPQGGYAQQTHAGNANGYWQQMPHPNDPGKPGNAWQHHGPDGKPSPGGVPPAAEPDEAKTSAGKTWHETLGFQPGDKPTQADIDKKFRKLSISCHPDKFIGKPEQAQKAEEFKALGEAKDLAYKKFGF